MSNEAGKEQKLKLPKYVEELMKSKFEIRNDVLAAVINVVFKAAELSNAYIDVVKFENSILYAWAQVLGDYAEAHILLQNGIEIKAALNGSSSWITFRGINECECVCGEK